MPSLLYGGMLVSALFEIAWLASAVAARTSMAKGIALMHMTFGRWSFTPTDATALLVIVPMVIITWAFRTRRRWARHAAVAFWLVPLTASPFPPRTLEEWTAVLTAVGFAALLTSYLFRVDSVMAYYGGMNGQQEVTSRRDLSRTP
jgi:hypothetical protein